VNHRLLYSHFYILEIFLPISVGFSIFMRTLHEVHKFQADTFSHYLPVYPRSSKWFYSLQVFRPHFVCIFHFSLRATCPRPSHSPRLDRPNNTWSSVKVIKFFIMQSSLASHHFLPPFLVQTLSSASY